MFGCVLGFAFAWVFRWLLVSGWALDTVFGGLGG